VGDSEIEKTRSGQEAFKNCYVSGPPRALALSIIYIGRGGAMKLRVTAASGVRDPG